MKELILRNYNAVVLRGLIKPATTDEEFYLKLLEEFEEVEAEFILGREQEKAQELTDLIVVCMNYLHHKGFDIELLLTKNAEKNEFRANNKQPKK